MRALRYALKNKANGRIVSTHRTAASAGRSARVVDRPQLLERHTRPGTLLLSECYGPCADEVADREYVRGLNS